MSAGPTKKPRARASAKAGDGVEASAVKTVADVAATQTAADAGVIAGETAGAAVVIVTAVATASLTRR